MGVSKNSDHIQIKIQIQNSSQEPSESSKAPNQDLKDMDVLCTFEIKKVSPNFEHVCTKDHQLQICKESLENGCFKDQLPWFWNMAEF